MATRRKIAGTVWNQELALGFRSTSEIQQACERLLMLMQQRPFQTSVAAIYVGNILVASGECVRALRSLEAIGQGARGE